MEIIPRIVFDRVALKLPANAKDLLRIGSLTIYDLLQLIVQSVNKVVLANDRNIDKEEEFLSALMAALNKWADQQETNYENVKNSILNYIMTGELSTEGFITSYRAFGSDFWLDLANALLTGCKILAPGQEGNDYNDNGRIETGSRWVLRLNMWSGGYKWVDLSDLVNNIQIMLDEERGAVFQDNNNNFEEIGVIPFATKEEGGLMHRTDKERLDGIYIGKVGDGLDALYIDGEAFVLQRYVKPETEYEYLTPQILGFSYGEDISANGGTAHPYVGIDQQVRIKGSGGIYKVIHIIANYEYNEETGKMDMIVTTNKDYMKSGGKVELEFEYQTLPSNVVGGKDGVVSKTTASTSNERTEVAVVTVKATINGMECANTSTTSVYQEAALFSAANISIPSSGEESFFDIEKSEGVRVTANSIAAGADWFAITDKKVETRYVRIYYKVLANNGTEKRETDITAFTNLSDETIVIAHVTQQAESQSITANVEDNIGAGASDFREITLTKTSGVTLTEEDVYAGENDDWITVTGVEIYDERIVITYTADANDLTSTRTGHIYVDTSLGEKSATITIKQAAKAVISVNGATVEDNAYKLSYSGVAGGSASAKTITVYGQNLTGDITVEKSGDATFTVSKKSITKNNASRSTGDTLTITWTPPATAGTRTGTVTLKAANADDVVISLSGEASGATPDVYAYYGADAAAPTTQSQIEAANSYKLTGENTISVGGAKCPWVAVPTGSATVTCKDGEGAGGGDNVELTVSVVGDYTVYSFPMPFVMPTIPIFTITLN